jgi:hypothetical protein
MVRTKEFRILKVFVASDRRTSYLAASDEEKKRKKKALAVIMLRTRCWSLKITPSVVARRAPLLRTISEVVMMPELAVVCLMRTKRRRKKKFP